MQDAPPPGPESAPAPDAAPQIVPLRTLERIHPYSRNPARRGFRLLGPLRRQLLKDPVETIEDPAFRVARCIAIQAGSTDLPRTMRVVQALRARFGDEMVRAPLAQALVHLRVEGKALQMLRREAAAEDADPGAQLELARMAMLSGDSDAALAIYERALPRLLAAGDRRRARVVGSILLEAGRDEMLRATLPDVIAAQVGLDLAAGLAPPPGDTRILCISMDKDAARFQATSAFLATGGRLERLPAVAGASLPQSQRALLCARAIGPLSASETGCALSHIAAWEAVAAGCAPEEYALVVEDDARFIHGGGRGLTEVLAAARAADPGLLFVNQRACHAATRAAPFDGEMRILPLTTDLPPEWLMHDPGWGGDGYLLNGRTAQLMVDAFAETGLLGAVDWQMMLMSRPDLPDWLRTGDTWPVHDALTRRGTWPLIPGHICNLPLIRCRDHGFSSINAG